MDQAVLNELLREGDVVLVAAAVRLDPAVMNDHRPVEADAAKLGLHHEADHIFGLFLHGGGLVLALDGAFRVYVLIQAR